MRLERMSSVYKTFSLVLLVAGVALVSYVNPFELKNQ